MSNARSISAPLKIGVVGLGAFGRLHVETIANLSEAQLVALVDRDEQQLAQMANSFSEVTPWKDIETALADSDVEAWVVASSTASHVSITEKILTAGKSVLLEKPIASSVAEAKRLAPLISAGSRNLMMGHVLLFNSEFTQLQQEIEQRGPFAYLDCVRHRPVTTLEGYPGESPFHLTMVHDLYMALVLKNREEPHQITAQVHRTQQGQCDLALAQLQWEDGTLASFTASFMTPDGLGSEGYDRLEAFGAGWAARINANPRPLEIWDDRSRWPMTLEMSSAPGSSYGMLAEELRCFCRVVHRQQPVPVGATYQDAIQLLGWLQQMEAAVS
jgi:predicted dehydrogenase